MSKGFQVCSIIFTIDSPNIFQEFLLAIIKRQLKSLNAFNDYWVETKLFKMAVNSWYCRTMYPCFYTIIKKPGVI